VADQSRAHALIQHFVLPTTAFVTLGLGNLGRDLRCLSLRRLRGDSILGSLSMSILAVLLTPAAVVAVALGFWRLGADPGWTNHFLITTGLFSHCQAWFALAVGAQTTAHFVKHWQKTQIQEVQAIPTHPDLLPELAPPIHNLDTSAFRIWPDCDSSPPGRRVHRTSPAKRPRITRIATTSTEQAPWQTLIHQSASRACKHGNKSAQRRRTPSSIGCSGVFASR
jgi:hypothetical protein